MSVPDFKKEKIDATALTLIELLVMVGIVADNLRLAVQMINSCHRDAVILSGDVGEIPGQRAQA